MQTIHFLPSCIDCQGFAKRLHEPCYQQVHQFIVFDDYNRWSKYGLIVSVIQIYCFVIFGRLAWYQMHSLQLQFSMYFELNTFAGYYKGEVSTISTVKIRFIVYRSNTLFSSTRNDLVLIDWDFTFIETLPALGKEP